MLVDPATQGDLLAQLGRGGGVEENLGEIGLDGHDAASLGRAADVDHQNLVLGELLNLGLLLVVRLDSEETAQEEVLDLNLDVDGRERALGAEHLADETIATGELGVDHCRDEERR